MNHRLYPNPDRARHQLDRHNGETPPRHATPAAPLTTAQAFERWAAAIRSATPTAQQLIDAWNAGLKPRPVGSEEKTG